VAKEQLLDHQNREASASIVRRKAIAKAIAIKESQMRGRIDDHPWREIISDWPLQQKELSGREKSHVPG